MKKNFLFVAFSAAVLLVSCTEKIPIGVLGGSGEAIIDTNYAAPVESKDTRKMLVEEATGVQCSNCPDGAKVLKQAEEAHPGRVIIVGLHAGNLTSPIRNESQYDFRTDYAKQLMTTYFGGDINKPAAAFDRTTQQGGSASPYFVESRNTWLNIVNQRIAVASMLNLDVTSKYNADSNDFIITVKGAYTASTSKKQNLTIMIIEDSIVDAQDDADGSVIKEYTHMHVLRDMITSYTGNPILSDLSSIEAGRVFIKSFRYKIPPRDPEKGPEWKVENLNVIAFIHNDEGADKEVQQAEEIKLK